MAEAGFRLAAVGWLACLSAQAVAASPVGAAEPPAIEYKTLTPAEAAKATVVELPAPAPPPLPVFRESIGMTETYYIPMCEMSAGAGPYRTNWREISDFHARNRVPWLSEADRDASQAAHTQAGSRAPEPNSRPEAIYPAAAGGKVGEVVLKVIIDAEGRTRDAMVICSNDPVFHAPALAFARQVSFEPALRDGRPAADYGNVSMRFYPGGPQYGFRRHK